MTNHNLNENNYQKQKNATLHARFIAQYPLKGEYLSTNGRGHCIRLVLFVLKVNLK